MLISVFGLNACTGGSQSGSDSTASTTPSADTVSTTPSSDTDTITPSADPDASVTGVTPGITDNNSSEGTQTIMYTQDNLEEYTVPEWYQDAKFGIFIHYGVYTVPAYGDEWYGRSMYIKDAKSAGGDNIFLHHLNTYGATSIFGYKDFIPAFNESITLWSQNNMAEEWAALFNAAGAKYVVPVAIHHDSFALYDSDIQTTYSSVAQAGVDYVAQLKEAISAYGMKLGLSNHFAENDWFFDDEAGAGTDMADPAYSELYGVSGFRTEAHIRKWYAISMELIEKYEPDLIYYDWQLDDAAFAKYSDANRYLMLAEYYNMAQTWEGNEGVVCCYKNNAFTQAQALLDKERSSLSEISTVAWQTDTSVSKNAWCYIDGNTYRTGEEFIGALVDIVSKNGNLLLNVGPKADGTMPEEVVTCLTTIGSWLNTYGDAIYATRPWLIYGEGSSNNTGDSFTYASDDIRFTRSKDSTSLYITTLTAPESATMTVKSLASGIWDSSTIDKICLIDGDKRTELNWMQTSEALIIAVPKDTLTGAYSVEVTFKDNGTIPVIALDALSTCSAASFYASENIVVGESDTDGSAVIYTDSDKGCAFYYLNPSDKHPSLFYAEVANSSFGTIELYENSPEGTLLGTLTLDSTNKEGYNTYATGVIGIKSGVFKLCIVLNGDIILSDFKFACQNKVNVVIQAEDYNGKSGSVKAEACADGGQNLGYVSSGDFVKYNDVDFGDNCNKLIMRLAGTGQSCRIRIDYSNGDIIAETGVISTGSWSNYRTYEYEISGVTGIHDVYITYDTGNSCLNVNWFVFTDPDFNLDLNDYIAVSAD